MLSHRNLTLRLSSTPPVCVQRASAFLWPRISCASAKHRPFWCIYSMIFSCENSINENIKLLFFVIYLHLYCTVHSEFTIVYRRITINATTDKLENGCYGVRGAGRPVETQRGSGNHYRAALSQSHSVCAEITEGVEREETWGGMSP